MTKAARLAGRVRRTAKQAVAFSRAFLSNRSGSVGAVIVAVAILVALFAPQLAPTDPYRLSRDTFRPPGPEHILGTDNVGRDMASRIVWGTRTSLVFAVGAAGVSLLIGVLLGAISGYFGGLVDQLLSRIFEVFLMVPRLFLVILLVAVFGSNAMIAMVVIGLTLWPSNAKLMRAQVLTLKSRAYVRASLGAGASHMYVLMRHIVPNGMSAVVANSSLQMAYAVLLEASLSFLGLGDPNVVSWGQIIEQGQSYMRTAWWIVTLPGLALVLLIVGIYLLGDGLAVRLNPRLAGRAASQ